MVWGGARPPDERGENATCIFSEAFSGDPCFAERYAGQALNATPAERIEDLEPACPSRRSPWRATGISSRVAGRGRTFAICGERASLMPVV